MYWRRDLVVWRQNPKIFGQQQLGATLVDFGQQKGLYLLHDRRDVIYAGRAVDQSLGARLLQHIYDRLNGRWDRFSWFGFLPVSEEGKIQEGPWPRQFGLPELVSSFEAILIEALEPPQNRRRGDDLSAVEFLQAEDPQLKQAQKKRYLEELLAERTQ